MFEQQIVVARERGEASPLVGNLRVCTRFYVGKAGGIRMVVRCGGGCSEWVDGRFGPGF